jgi:sulfur carrier protein
MITVQLNQERVQLPEDATLASLIASLPEAPKALATAVNSEFVARHRRAECPLKDGDVVTTFMPVTGG